MMCFDAHSDILYDVARRRLAGEEQVLDRCHAPRLRRGGVEGLVLALWCTAEDGESFWDQVPEADSDAGRYAITMRCAREELAQSTQVQLVRTVREAEEARRAGRIYAFLGIEGMAAFGGDVEALDRAYAGGLRLGMMTWNEENPFATGAKGEAGKGLTVAGKAAVRRMQDLGIVVDVSHLNEGGFWDVMDLASAPVIASHSDCRAICDVARNLTDEQLRAIRDTGGVVGVNVYHSFVHKEREQQTVETLARHAIHMAEVMGVEHVGCGFDFCEFLGPGNDGARGMEDAARIGNFFGWLERFGMSEKEREMVARANFLRVLEKVLG